MEQSTKNENINMLYPAISFPGQMQRTSVQKVLTAAFLSTVKSWKHFTHQQELLTIL